jgi:hypothetical protein
MQGLELRGLYTVGIRLPALPENIGWGGIDDSDKHSSLLQCQFFYNRKKSYDTYPTATLAGGPESSECDKTFDPQ